MEVFEIKNWGVYQNLYAQSDTLLLADVFESFRDMCIEIYDLDPTNFFLILILLKKWKVELKLLTVIDMLLMVEKGIRGGVCQATHSYAKASNKYMKNYDKTLIHHFKSF